MALVCRVARAGPAARQWALPAVAVCCAGGRSPATPAATEPARTLATARPAAQRRRRPLPAPPLALLPPPSQPLPPHLTRRGVHATDPTSDDRPPPTPPTGAARAAAEPPGTGVWRRLGWLPEQIAVDPSTVGSRLRFILPSTATHLCLGSIYAWSVFNEPLTRLNGVVCPSSADWALADITTTFSLVMGGFCWGAVLARYMEAWGPRVCVSLGAVSLGSGFALAGLSAQTNSLACLYAGGLVWGLSNGIAYIPPVANLLRWFPDRKGFAGAMCIGGFGAGSIVCSSAAHHLLEHFRAAPEYLGRVADVSLITEGGKMFVGAQEVVVATTNDLVGWDGLAEGVYVVGTGSTGLTGTLLTIGSAYFLGMAAVSTAFQTPSGPVSVSSDSDTAPTVTTKHNVTADSALRTPQFYLTYFGLGMAYCGSYMVLSSGKTLISETFGTTMPDIVTPAYATGFIAALGMANLSGRLFWPMVSDAVASRLGDPLAGRRVAFCLMWGVSPPLYVAALWAIHEASANPGPLPLTVFTASVLGIISSFGGTTACAPALAGDLFGLRHVGTISARYLSVVLPAAFIGPPVGASLRQGSVSSAIEGLADKVDAQTFAATFGAGKDQLAALITQNAVTIPRLMELAPPGTVDPTPFVYDQALYFMLGLQATAFATMLLVRPVAAKFHQRDH